MRAIFEMLRSQGPVATLRHALLWPIRRLQRRRILRAIDSSDSLEDRFTKIYTHNLWGDAESASGTGSNLRHTANLRAILPQLMREHGIKTVFDAPCGDFHWMREVVAKTDVRYVGGDIVRPLIEKLSHAEGTARVSFMQIDLTRDSFPAADLMICRDCLFHLSYRDCRAVLRNFLAAGIPLLLTTTHELRQGAVNHDIATGDFRPMDLLRPPYRFPADAVARIEDWLPPDPPRFMCLWNREQVARAVASLDAHLADRGSPQEAGDRARGHVSGG